MSLAEGGDTIAFFKSAVSPGSRPDKIDLSEVDDPNTVGDDVWAFAGSACDSSITGPQATITLVGGNSVLSLYSADGDDLADFTISLNNVSLQPGDVIW